MKKDDNPIDTQPLRILLVMEQCDPGGTKVARMGFRLFSHLRQSAAVTLVTPERNRGGFSGDDAGAEIDFIEMPSWLGGWAGAAERMAEHGPKGWLPRVVSYPAVAGFDRRVNERYRWKVENGEFDAVMCATPLAPTFPFTISKACRRVPFLLGPVRGSVPFSGGKLGKWLQSGSCPGALRRAVSDYLATYRDADGILAGSEVTGRQIRERLGVDPGRIHRFPEKGVDEAFFAARRKRKKQGAPIRLLFPGPLVASSGADIVVESLHRACRDHPGNWHLILAGTGPEERALRRQVRDFGLEDRVRFAGQIPPEELPALLASADLFLMPAERDFDGAGILEAMAAGLPCVVADHPGIREYARASFAWKLRRGARSGLVEQMTEAIAAVAERPERLSTMARAARRHARKFSWEAKAEKITGWIREAVEKRRNPARRRQRRRADAGLQKTPGGD